MQDQFQVLLHWKAEAMWEVWAPLMETKTEVLAALSESREVWELKENQPERSRSALATRKVGKKYPPLAGVAQREAALWEEKLKQEEHLAAEPSLWEVMEEPRERERMAQPFWV